MIDKKKFAKMALDKNVETFVIYISSLNLGSILIDLGKKAQITLLLIKKVKISTKYSNFYIVFLEKKFYNYYR